MNQKGFTLIELVMILVLVGILAVFVAPKLPNITSSRAISFSDKLRADIRYAQNLAMTRNRRTRVILTNTSYAITQDSSGASNCGSFAAVGDPAEGGGLSVALDTGDYAGIKLTVSAMTCLEYDSLGRPYNCTLFPLSCSTTLSGIIVPITANAVAVGSVSVSSQTGAVN